MAMLDAGDGRLGQLQTGDLVLFAERRPLLGLLARLGWTVWTHVGMVLRESPDAEPRLWEAAPHRPALREVSLAERVAHFRGQVSARHLDHELNPLHHARLDALRRELAATERKRGLLDLMSAGDDGWLGASTRTLGLLAAAELVAEAYQRLGLLEGAARGGRAAGEFRPRHFAAAAGLQLKQGYALGPELVLQAPAGADEPSRLAPQPAGA